MDLLAFLIAVNERLMPPAASGLSLFCDGKNFIIMYKSSGPTHYEPETTIPLEKVPGSSTGYYEQQDVNFLLTLVKTLIRHGN